MREIAAGAGVTAMLVNRYFGSKERLFAEAVAESMATTSVLGPQIANPASPAGDRCRARRHHPGGRTPLEGFQIMLRSASSARAARIARKLIESHHQQSIAAALTERSRHNAPA